MSKKTESREGMPRRALLKSALMVLGASVIVQPSGAVLGLAPQIKDDSNKAKPDSKAKSGHIKGESTHIKGESAHIKGESAHIKGESAHIKGESKVNKTNKSTRPHPIKDASQKQ